jgi:AsmA protein
MAASRVKKILKITGISLLVFLVILAVLPELFPGYFSRKIKAFVNENIEGELNFGKARFSVLKHFPALTLSLYDFSLKGSAPFKTDTLIAGQELAFGVDLPSIFREKLSINQFFLMDAFINIQVDSLGNANYNVVKSTPDSLPATVDTNSGGASLRIKKMVVRNTRLVYHDRSLPMLLEMGRLDYTGKGDLSEEIVDLASQLTSTGVNFSYDGEQYAVNKSLAGGLVTRINTGNLELSFTRNDLKINKLPVDFKGFIRFPESGYDIDLRFKCSKANLTDVVSVLPPAYLDWMAETELKGTADLFLDLVGPYRASPEVYPTLAAGIDLENGFIRNKQAPVPVSDMAMHLRLGMPGLSADSFYVDMDTLQLALGKGFVRGNLHAKGTSLAGVNSRLQANADLGQLMQATGIKDLDMQGKLKAEIALDAGNSGGLDAKERTLPYIDARVDWRNGLVKTGYYPEPIDKINMAVVVQNKTGTYRDMNLELLPISFEFAGKPFAIKADVKNFDNVQYDITSRGTLDIGRISKVFIADTLGVTVEGLIETDLRLQGSQADAMAGRLSRLNNSGTLVMKNIRFSSKDFPYPLVVETGNFHAHQDKLVADNLKLVYGRNLFRMKGFYNNLFPYMLGTGPLEGGLSLEADKLYLEDFLAEVPASVSTQTSVSPSSTLRKAQGGALTLTKGQAGSTSTSTSSSPSTSVGVAMVPSDLSLKLDAVVKEAIYDKMKMEDLKGVVRLDKGKLMVEDAGMRLAGSTTMMDATYEPVSATKALFDLAVKADSFDIQRFYKEVPLFAEMAPSAKTAKGQVSLKYQLAGKLDAGMMPAMPSLKGGGTLSLHNVQVKGMKLFAAIANKSGKDSINNPNLKAVNLNTTISNNVMTLERTKMKIMGFRPRLEGQATLDGKLNLKFRLGLPPFGIIGIPMTITGTMENPKVEMRKGKEEDELEETEEEEMESEQ